MEFVKGQGQIQTETVRGVTEIHRKRVTHIYTEKHRDRHTDTDTQRDTEKQTQRNRREGRDGGRVKLGLLRQTQRPRSTKNFVESLSFER